MFVVGTAGHVDHGKSTLIAALTGIHPDRLKEEQEREMTIELGFAWLSLPDGQEIGIVDVPGHSDFIANMLSGVGGIDAALLVIAADEGVMPQTREHLAILDLLQVQTGLVVLTKVDLVDDPEWLRLVETDIRRFLKSTFLQDAPILRVSARTQAGLPELVQSLSTCLQKTHPKLDLGRPRLPVDRVFTMPGFGTVVTGTLLDGSLRVGEEVILQPSGLTARIRGLQTHKKNETNAQPGSRTAVNLSGINKDQVGRGDWLSLPGQYEPTQRLDVQFRLLAGASSPLRHQTEVKFFSGTSETTATVRLLGVDLLKPGETCFLQLDMLSPVIAMRGDHYIFRRPSPGETLGGGVIVNPHPARRHKRHDEKVIQALENMSHGSPTDLLLEKILAAGPALLKEVLASTHIDAPLALQAYKELRAAHRIEVLEDIVLTASQWSTLQRNIEQLLEAYHSTHPLRRGMPREELRSKLKTTPRFFSLAMARLVSEQSIKEDQKLLSLPTHRVHFTPFQQVKVDKILPFFVNSPYSPPSVHECQAIVGQEVFSALLDAGELVLVSPEVVFRKVDFETMQAKVEQAFTTRPYLTLAEVRDLLGTSRKYVQALLEYFDSINLTVREGEGRRLKTG